MNSTENKRENVNYGHNLSHNNNFLFKLFIKTSRENSVTRYFGLKRAPLKKALKSPKRSQCFHVAYYKKNIPKTSPKWRWCRVRQFGFFHANRDWNPISLVRWFVLSHK